MSSLSSQISPTLAIFVSVPFPLVKIKPRSLVGVSVKPSPSLINVSDIVLFVDFTVLLTFKSPYIVTEAS